MTDVTRDTTRNTALALGTGLLAFRWLMLAALPYESLVAYGDLRHFHPLAQLAAGAGGLPFGQAGGSA